MPCGRGRSPIGQRVEKPIICREMGKRGMPDTRRAGWPGSKTAVEPYLLENSDAQRTISGPRAHTAVSRLCARYACRSQLSRLLSRGLVSHLSEISTSKAELTIRRQQKKLFSVLKPSHDISREINA